LEAVDGLPRRKAGRASRKPVRRSKNGRHRPKSAKVRCGWKNVSFGAASIKVLKETGIECILKKVCEGKTLKPGEKCESELEEPGVKPEYELEVEWNGEKFIKKFPA
jgi:hypothetical protein